jgi:predicted porin
MQKKIIALAVAGLMSGAAFAQSNVTIYGVADGYYGRLSAEGKQSNNYFNSGGLSGSRLGFRGAEDLGGGLKAVFEYELAFNLDNTGTTAEAINSSSAGNGINGTRQSYVGLGGGFGTVVLGRLQTPGYYVGKFDALASSTISPQSVLVGKAGWTIAPSNNGRVNNSVAYMSPNFSGFSAVVAYGSGEENVLNAEKESVTGLGLNYSNGPLDVGYVYHRVGNVGATNVAGATFPNLTENMIGAAYNFGVVKVLGSWQNKKTTGSATDKLWQLGVVAPIGAGNVHLGYGKLDMDAANMDAKSWTLAYTHSLSKRTTAYAGYNRTTNDDLQTAGILAPTAGGASKALVGGVRHTF